MTEREPTEELFALRVTRVDLVDAGDNPEARVTLYKRKSEPKPTKKATPLMCPNCATTLPTSYGEKGTQVGRYCPECGAKIRVSASGGDKVKKGVGVMADLDLSKLEDDVREPIEEHVKALGDELAAEKTRATDFEAKAKKAEADLKVEKTRADKAAADLAAFKKEHPDEDDVLKGVPDEIRKRLEDTEAEVAKMREAAEVADFVKRATALDVPGTKPEKLGAVLHRVAKGKATEDDVKEIERLLKGMRELAKKGGLTKELGSSGDPSGEETAWDEAVAKGRAIVAEGKAATLPLAMTMVWKQHPDLDKRVQAEKYGPAR